MATYPNLSFTHSFALLLYLPAPTLHLDLAKTKYSGLSAECGFHVWFLYMVPDKQTRLCYFWPVLQI